MKQRIDHSSRQMKPGPGWPDGRCFRLRRERGMTLILVLVLLVITAAASIFFHNSMVGSTRVSGANRDNTASLLLAESAMETVRGRFITNQVSNSSCNKIAYGQGEGPVYNIDHCDAYEFVQGEGWWADPNQVGSVMVKLPYVFSAVEGTSEWDIQRTPNILQWVANGEANDAGSVALNANSWHDVPSTTTSMTIEDLFGDAYSPFLFKLNDNGLLIPSEEDRWIDEPELEKAAAWLQVTRHCDPDIKDEVADGFCESEFDQHALDFWVQAVGQVGFARSYLQRYVGTFYPPTQVGGLAALLEASNIDRREKP